MNNLLDRTSVQPSESVAPTARNQWVMPVFEARLLRLESANGSSGRPAFVGRPTCLASSVPFGSHRLGLPRKMQPFWGPAAYLGLPKRLLEYWAQVGLIHFYLSRACRFLHRLYGPI